MFTIPTEEKALVIGTRPAVDDSSRLREGDPRVKDCT